MRQCNMLAIDDANITDRGIEYQQSRRGARRIIRWSWALKTVVSAAIALRKPVPALPENVAPMPSPLFPSRYCTQQTARRFKSTWQRAMAEYVADGGARFWEHDIRAKSESDAQTDARAQDLPGHASASTTRRHYRRAPAKVRPLR